MGEIMIGDDNPMMVKIVQDQFEHKGYLVSTFQDGMAGAQVA